MKIARLIMTLECNRRCVNCCNKHTSILSKATRIHNVSQLEPLGFNQVIITGGEPMLYPDRVIGIAQQAAKQGSEVFLYTAMYRPEIVTILNLVKGVHYTLHAPMSRKDFTGFHQFQRLIAHWVGSYRLYVDPNIKESILITPCVWKRVEIKPWLLEGDCPLPMGEELFILDS